MLILVIWIIVLLMIWILLPLVMLDMRNQGRMIIPDYCYLVKVAANGRCYAGKYEHLKSDQIYHIVVKVIGVEKDADVEKEIAVNYEEVIKNDY